MIAARNLSKENFLGKGSLTEVYKGVLPGRDNKAIAIKRMVKVENYRHDRALK